MSALTGVRIVELAESVAGEYCGKLLADFGAEVIKIERPDRGSPTRAMAPIIGGGGGPERSALFAYLNTNKRSVVLDVCCAAEVEKLHQIIGTANAVIDDHAPSSAEAVGLSANDTPRRHPSVVFCSITPYGAEAPPEFQNAKSFTVFNSSGWGYHTPSHADPDKPPLQGPGRFRADYEAGLDAALCTAASLFSQLHSGRGEFIDVSQHAVLASRADCALGRFITGEIEPQNTRDDYDQQGPASFFACADGFVYLYMTSRNHWSGLKKLMGQPEWLDAFEDDWLEFSVTHEKVTTFQSGFAEWVAGLTKDAPAEEAQRLGVPLVPVKSAADLKNSPQYRYRGFFQDVTHPVLGTAAYPGVPYLMSASPARLASAAPSLGQHTTDITERLKAPRPAVKVKSAQLKPPKVSRGGPLEGVRVIELTKVWAGPDAGKLLAFLGAAALCGDPRYAGIADRREHADALDHDLARLTGSHHAGQLAQQLRSAGVPSSKSATSLDVISDQLLWDRELYRFVSDHREGQRPIVAAPWRMSVAPAQIARGASDLGEHNDYVSERHLGRALDGANMTATATIQSATMRRSDAND